MNLYPRITNIKRNQFVIELLFCVSMLAILACLIVNYAVQERFSWSILVILGIIYTWIVTLYSIKENRNIAFHVMLQLIILSILVYAVDLNLGFHKWSVEIAIPTIIISANIIIFILTIIHHKRYAKYVIYQLVIFLLSMIPLARNVS